MKGRDMIKATHIILLLRRSILFHTSLDIIDCRKMLRFLLPECRKFILKRKITYLSVKLVSGILMLIARYSYQMLLSFHSVKYFRCLVVTLGWDKDAPYVLCFSFIQSIKGYICCITAITYFLHRNWYIYPDTSCNEQYTMASGVQYGNFTGM